MSTLKPECSTCQNENCFIKRNCLTTVGEAFVKQKITFACKKGQQFIIEGSPVQGLFFIYKGKAKITQTGINGREQIVRFSKEGEIIGHRGFAIGEQYHISAEALEDTIVCNFSNRIMFDMLKDIPELTFDMMLFYAKELNTSETKVRKIAQMTVRERVVDTLLYLDRKFGQTKELLNLQLTRREIADFSGTTEEQVIRILSILKKEGLIRSLGRKIGITNIQKMKNEISEHNYFIAT
jgi:CRP-like cAMP-binding protein